MRGLPWVKRNLDPGQSHIEKEQVMQESIAYVGLDVHRDSISVALAEGVGEPMEVGQMLTRPGRVVTNCTGNLL